MNFGAGVDRAVIDLTSLTVGMDVVFDPFIIAAANHGGQSLYQGAHAESNEVRGDAGADAVFGGGLADVLTGNSGDDTLDGGAGNDQTFGGIGFDSLIGGDGRDRIEEGIGSDTLIGGNGNDTLIGGASRDTLTGELGFDVFVFNVAPTNPTSYVITDFNPFFDSIQLASTAFVGLTVGALDAAAFAANLTGAPTDAMQRIIYDTDTGRLLFDSDGNGAGARIQVATLGTGLSLGAVDFSMV